MQVLSMDPDGKHVLFFWTKLQIKSARKLCGCTAMVPDEI